MLKKNVEFFSSLNKSKVIYCQFKSTDHIEAGLNGRTDLDLLVALKDCDEFERLANQHNFKKTKAGYGSSDRSRQGYLGYDCDADRFIYLDVHYTVIIGRDRVRELHSLNLAEKILSRRVLHSEFPIFVPKKNDELSLLFLRIVMKMTFYKFLLGLFFGKRYWEEWDREVDFLMGSDQQITFTLNESPELKIFFDIFLSKNLKLGDVIAAKRIVRMQHVFKHPTYLILIISLSKMVFAGLSHYSRKYQLLNHVFVRKVTYNTAPLVVFIGVDGAGKSTQIRRVNEAFSWKLDTQVTYLGAGQGNLSWQLSLLKRLKELIDPLRSRSTLRVNDATTKKEKVGILKLIWALALLRDKQRKLRKIQMLRSAGVTVFTDRFPQIHTEGFNDGPLLTPLRKHKWSWLRSISDYERKIYNCEHIDAPTVIVLLNVSPSVSLSRDRSVTIDYLEARRKAVMGFQKTFDNVNVIDGEQPPSEVTKSICSLIMANKW